MSSSSSETAKSEESQRGKEGEGEEERAQWGNQVQFILSAVGLAVGLGNIWRFPSMAYENGGSAFLIPYVLCGIFFGFPMVYADMTIGQFSRAGPGKAFGRYAAGFQGTPPLPFRTLPGIGWTMAVTSLFVALYVCVVISWAGVYLGWIVSGNSYKWTECGHSWNTDYCVSQDSVDECRKNVSENAPRYFFNGSCVFEAHNMTRQPAEEFFINWLTPRSNGIDSLGSIQWYVFGSLLTMWVITTLTLIKGIAIMGYLSYVIVPLPYLVIIILFFRGVTLEGAMTGIDYYLLKPDFSKLLHFKTWGNALKQLMFSINVGYGGLISLSSYSKPTNNHFRDSLIVITGDTLMSVIGGVTVFSTLGYLANRLGKGIDEVIESGTSLAFIAYPEAMKSMYLHYIWEFLFFIMLFFLGISSEVALVETFTGCIYDVFPKTKKFKWLVTIITCAVCFGLGVFMAGWYWFTLWDSHTGSTVPCIVGAMTGLILTFYGWKNIKQDLVDMRGKPRCRGIGRWFGPQSPIFIGFWGILCPLLALAAMVLTLQRDSVPMQLNVTKTDSPEVVLYEYPFWAEIVGWMMNLGPAIAIPCFFLYRCGEIRTNRKPFSYLFRPNRELKSYKRYYKQKGLHPPEYYEERKWEKDEESGSTTSSSA